MIKIDSQLLLDSFPHPAMIIREDRRILAANASAIAAGAEVGDYCWKGFGNAANLSDEHYNLYQENPDHEGIQCIFCRADNCLTNGADENDPLLQSDVGTFDTYWVPLNSNTYLHYASDITERKQAEESLIKSQQLLEQMGSISNVGGWLYDIETGDLQWTEEHYKIFELGPDHVPSVEEAIAFFTEESKPIITEAVQKLIDNGEPYDLELELITAKGNLRHIRSKGVADLEHRRIYGAIQDITLKKSAELALHNSYARFEDIATNAGDWIWEIDLKGRYTYTSGRIKDILGYNTDDVLGETVVSLMTKESAKETNRFFRKLLREKRPFKDFENWCYHKSGRLVCLSSSGSPAFNSDGKLVGYRGVDKDITIDKQDEVLLSARIEVAEDAQQHDLDTTLRKILDKAEAITDSQISFFHFVEDDQEYLRLQAWSERTLENFCKVEKGLDRHYPISRAGVWTDCILEKKPVIHNDYESLTHKKGLPEGHAHVVRELVVPIIYGGKVKAILGVGNKPFDYDERDSKFLERFFLFCWEILERKMAEEKVRETNAILQETQEIGKIGTWRYDFIEDIVSWSSENYRIFGASENSVPTFELFVETVHPDDRETVLAHFEEAKKSGIFDIEYRLLIDGQVKWVHGKAHFEYENGEPVRIIGFTQDITEKKNFQQAQLRSSQLSALGEVAAGVAHEINNPINGVINYAQVLLNKNDGNDPANDILQRIIKEGDRVSSIVRNLLNFASKNRDELSSLDIADIVNEPLNLNAQFFKKDGIYIDIGIPDDLPEIYGNKLHLEQVVLNILSNARHALNKKFPDPSNEKFIVIEANSSDGHKGGCVQLSVKDYGCGIPDKHRNKIFNPFFTTKAAGVGTGLGLSICHEILEKHNATISIESQVDKFTKVTVTFPAHSE